MVEGVLNPRVVARISELAAGPDVEGIAIFGSVARGDATRWSDVDVHVFAAAAGPEWRTRAHYVDDRLVMVVTDSIDRAYSELRDPAKAVWAVAALRDMRIVSDPNGRLAALQEAARTFEWGSVEAEAHRRERDRLVETIEYLHKIRAGIERHDASAVLHAERALVERCTRAVIVARGVLVRTENEWFRRAQEAAGPHWAELHERSFGLHGGDAFERGRAACQLFDETVRLLDDILDDDARHMIGRAQTLTRLP